MIKPLRSELEDIIQSVEFNSHTTFTFYGRRYVVGNDLDLKESFLDGSEKIAVLNLEDFIYQFLHCRQKLIDHYDLEFGHNYYSDRDFIRELSESNCGQGTWDPGWEVLKIENGGNIIVAQKEELTLWVPLPRFSPNGDAIAIGEKGKLRTSKEFRGFLPGFYMAIGDKSEIDGDNNINIVRIYWNIQQSGAANLMRELTKEINKNDMPFKFKILNSPSYFPRADSAVLYLNKQFLQNFRDMIATIYEHVKIFLNSLTPLFAKRLVSGISLAEDPNGGQSFGQNRSKILAEAIYHLYEMGISSKEEKMEKTYAYFKDRGLDLAKPYLNPNSVDYYDELFKGVFDH